MAMAITKRRMIMNRERQCRRVDLGAASIATRGTPFGSDDHAGSLKQIAGLSDE